MNTTARLNNIIRAWQEGRPAFASFAHADPQTAIEFSTAPYDGIIFEMEHNPFDVQALQDALQYLLNRRQIFTAPSLAPAVTPIVRVPGIGCVLIGEGDLSQELGFPRQYDHPVVHDVMAHVVATCKKRKVPVGHPHVTASNVERVLAEGFQFIMSAPVRTYGAIEQAKTMLTLK
jgi:2-keto-3-deoxy-L-rhamnonate aldolase RhmA